MGPRVIGFGFAGERNELCVWEEQSGKTGGDEWRCYGGSRLWHGPEIGRRCYMPDNEPVAYEITADGVVLRQNVEPWTGIAKEMKIKFRARNRVRFDFTVTNTGPWDADLCVWVLTLMRAGGTTVIPAPEQKRNLAPNSVLPAGALAFWPYTSLTDPRFTMDGRYFRMKQDPGDAQNFKIGMPVFEGWAAHYNEGRLFVKYFDHKPGERYPDYNSSFELYCCERYTELETLSPMKVLREGEALTHEEEWELHQCEALPENGADTGGFVGKYIHAPFAL